MSTQLEGKKIAILATDGFEQAELLEPRKALKSAGATTVVVAPKGGEIKGWSGKDWGESVKVDQALAGTRAEDFDALVLPGGVMNPDHLRMEPRAVELVRDFVDAGKPVAAVCHGPWLLVEADVLKGRRVTSWPSLKTDLRNAGARWVDEEVVVDHQVITSRKPDDLPAFSEAIIAAVSKGVAQPAHA